MTAILLCFSCSLTVLADNDTVSVVSDQTESQDMETSDAVTETENLTAASETVSFSVSDQSTVNSYLENGIYYLFLTESSNPDELTVTCDGDRILSCVNESGSAVGTIDTAGQSVTGSFPTGQKITINGASGNYTVCTMQSSLPSLCIDLAAGQTLDMIHADKDYKSTNATVTLTNTSDTSQNLSVGSVEMKGRGNTSWVDYDKKGYQIKFSKKQNLLNIDSGKGAKKWVLLANTCDASMMMNKLAYDLSANIGLSYSTKGKFADLWVNGDYRGTYLVSDKIETGESRVDLDDSGVISELDYVFYADEPTRFQDILGNHFTLKDPDSDAGKAAFENFQTLLNDTEEHLPAYNWNEVTSRLDVLSVAKMYLVNEYMANDEYTATSQYWYFDGSKIYAGPVWDFDSATYKQSTADKKYVFNSPIIAQLMQRSEFRSLVSSVYSQYKSQFVNMSSEVDELENNLKTSAAMNYTRWDQLGKTDAKSGVFKATYDENVQVLRQWLTDRSGSFTIDNSGASLYMDISKNRDTVRFTYVNTNGGNAPKFAFWNIENGQDDITWYSGTYIGNNTWTALASLSNHVKNGIFSLHVYDYFNTGNPVREIGMNYAVRKDVPASNTSVIVYRLYNPNSGEHFYTVNNAERSYLISIGWNDEGIGWYSDDAKTIPVYREYNPNAVAGSHNYTMNFNEHKYLSNIGWNNEGIAWYASNPDF